MKASPSGWNTYLTDREALKFSVAHIGLAPYWAGPRNEGNSLPFCDGEVGLMTCDAPATTTALPRPGVRPGLGFWRRIDDMVEAANDHQIVVFIAGMMEPVGGNSAIVHALATDAERYPPETEVVILARWVASRLSGSHVIFSPGFDSPPETKDDLDLRDLIKAVGGEISRVAPRHLVTNHWSATSELTTSSSCSQPNYSSYGMDELQSEPWLDFHMFQSGAICSLDRVVQRARSLPHDLEGLNSPPQVKKINVDGEATYDHGEAVNQSNRNNRFRARQTSWMSALNGAFGFTMGVGGAWDWGLCGLATPNACGTSVRFPSGWRAPLDSQTLPTRQDLASFRRIFSRMNWYSNLPNEQWRLTLNAGLSESLKQALIRDTNNLMAYLPDGESININAAGLSGDVGMRVWYFPTTATIDRNPATVTCNGTCIFQNPGRDSGLGSSDRVLLQPLGPIGGLTGWSESGAGTLQIFEGRFDPDETWGIWVRQIPNPGEPQNPGVRISDPGLLLAGHPAIARDGKGNYLAVWEADGEDDGVAEIRARRLASDGAPLGQEFMVSDGEGLEPQRPRVAVDGDGNAVVVWEALMPGDGRKLVYSRLVPASGGFETDPLPESPAQVGWPEPRVASDRDGNIVIARLEAEDDWSGANRIVVHYTGKGGRILEEEVAASALSESLALVEVVARESQIFTVLWERASGMQSIGLYARDYSSSGDALGDAYSVEAELVGGQEQ